MADSTPAKHNAIHNARYTDRPLPDYRHVPGRTPHPTRHPEGHSFGHPEASVRDLNSAPWWRCDEYLYGIDLFNLGYWWECHEALETLWLAAGLGTPAGHALQAVIQCAAAHLKVISGQTAGAKRLVEHAGAHAAWAGGPLLGLDLAGLVATTAAHVAEGGPAARASLALPAPDGGDSEQEL